MDDKQLCAFKKVSVVRIISQVPGLKHGVDLKRDLPTSVLVI